MGRSFGLLALAPLAFFPMSTLRNNLEEVISPTSLLNLSTRPGLAPRLGLGAESAAKANTDMTVTPTAMAVAEQAVERGCVVQLAEDFNRMMDAHAKMLRELNVVVGLSAGGWEAAFEAAPPLAKSLEQLFKAEDRINGAKLNWKDFFLSLTPNMITKSDDRLSNFIKGSNRTRASVLEELAEAHALVLQRFFSVRKAQQLCDERKDTIRDDILQQCMLDVGSTGETFVSDSTLFWGAWANRDSKKLSLDDGDRDRLVDLLKSKWALKKQRDSAGLVADKWESLGDLVSTETGSPQIFAQVEATELDGKLNEKTQQIVTLGFDEAQTEHHCRDLHKADSMNAAKTLLERLIKEVTDPVAARGSSGCEEVDGMYCPEGTSPMLQRNVNNKFISAASTALYWGNDGVMLTLGYMVGLLTHANAVMMAASFWTVPFTYLLTIPIASLAAVDWFPSCACTPTECAFDQELNACAMEPGRSANPFGRLPYPGQKCIMDPIGSNANGQVACQLTPCRPEDLDEQLAEGFRGTVGFKESALEATPHRARGTYNCLAGAAAGAAGGAAGGEELLRMEKIQVGAGSEASANWQSSRVELYTTLGLQPSAALAGWGAGTVAHTAETWEAAA